jgi:hypothetical protein
LQTPLLWVVERSRLILMDWPKHFVTEEQCREAIVARRWPAGFVCPACGCRKHAFVGALSCGVKPRDVQNEPKYYQ